MINLEEQKEMLATTSKQFRKNIRNVLVYIFFFTSLIFFIRFIINTEKNRVPMNYEQNARNFVNRLYPGESTRVVCTYDSNDVYNIPCAVVLTQRTLVLNILCNRVYEYCRLSNSTR